MTETRPPCGQCKHWFDEWQMLTPEDDDYGRCQAMEGVVLPLAWEWTTREVVGVTRGETRPCGRFEQKEPI